ncbi:hypothetical protein L211DRAFT_497418 [Terfezia boudieri ATCC MYA-4762]|uniref:Uncharacterized protein n=1 Tax=Terfezia boudieri ATCC MYA-4762 TaxID=1051890 RepID=A0A3N4LDA3_9PEZI|nr:hypothetical protein L211DRAFT_497418 [Terfezia boudieri ATCC MYA-4762]
MRSPFLMSISSAKYITSDDAAFPTLLPSSNNHRMPLIWALLLSSSIHLRIRPGLYLVGAACKTTACVRTCVVRLVGGVAICAARSGWTNSIPFCDVGLFGGFWVLGVVALRFCPCPLVVDAVSIASSIAIFQHGNYSRFQQILHIQS